MIEYIVLSSNARVEVDLEKNKSTCKECGQTIYWSKTKNGKNMPICQDENTQEWISHFANCPFAKDFRKI